MEDLKSRTAREVLEDHLSLAQKWEGVDVDEFDDVGPQAKTGLAIKPARTTRIMRFI